MYPVFYNSTQETCEQQHKNYLINDYNEVNQSSNGKEAMKCMYNLQEM